MEVAVKTLNPESLDVNETKFLREAAIMGQFLHPNVVKLLGVVTVGEPVSFSQVVEFNAGEGGGGGRGRGRWEGEVESMRIEWEHLRFYEVRGCFHHLGG